MFKEGFKETKVHGRLDFPFAVYRGEIPKWLRGFSHHWHKEFEIIYIYSGNGIITINSSVYECSIGDIFFVPPDAVHSIHQKDNLPMEYFNILFKLSLLESDENSPFFQKYLTPIEQGLLVPPERLTPDSKTSKKLIPVLQSICDRWQEDFSKDMLFVKTNIFYLVNEIYGICEPAHKGIRKHEKNISRLKPVFQFITENYNTPVSIQDAALMCNYSESFFMKAFKNATGMTFTAYLNDYRLEKAEELLKSTNKNVSEVALSCGFESLSYFIKCFKNKWGYTPHKAKK